MKRSMKQFMTGVVAAMAMGVMADTANTVNVTKFHQSYPYSGKATVEYTVGTTLSGGTLATAATSTGARQWCWTASCMCARHQ